MPPCFRSGGYACGSCLCSRKVASSVCNYASGRKIASSTCKVDTAAMFAWDDLRYFLAFAREGSMQGAAKALGVNQSTVQRRISELEDRLGRRLVERHLSSYRLTELGEELRPRAESVEVAIGAFERHL